ncbi:MAG: adenosylmethionine--8-amino-7-oxononanoate transaminase [Chitinophagales bacterium]
MNKNLSKRSVSSVWHPFTQMKTAAQPIAITKGKGTLLYTEEGEEIIDAISSWWTTIHGHAHPYIAEKIKEQADTLEHVIFAGFTHEPAVRLSERLLEKLPDNQSKTFFSDNGSTSVEVGIKMAFQYWYNLGEEKTKIIAFKQAYHGDTFGAMSVGNRSDFSKPFAPFLFDVAFVESPALDFDKCLEQISNHVKNEDVAAIIFEPLVQGSCGMLMYSPEQLEQIMQLCKLHNVLVIADEVMTGFYRTGKFFATDHCTTNPDIFCLSKGLTGGVMAMSITTCTQEIYNAFLSDKLMEKTFFHGHSFTANPIACATANASLDLIEQEETQAQIAMIVERHQLFAEKLRTYDCIENIRQQGTIVAFDIIDKSTAGYGSSIRDKIYYFFLEKGILLRPLGNTVYILPPYCISKEQLDIVYSAIEELLVQDFIF